ncbi:kinase-like protein [Rhizopus microsporus var. microsporus]|uniref:Kinase-like protein n=1 Tax=Rhizopus microsporus var. microsporus TaxID=86635 RepID=A0A1X0QR47_RHIZD|nr:kinase-like protein [Rhizopus microsporus var. microsporus]
MPGAVILQQNHQPSYPYRIAVIENNMQVMSGVSCIVYHVILEDKDCHLSLVRYLKDFIELDSLLHKHFPKYRVPLPKLIKNNKINTLRSLFTLKKRKTNAERLQAYLNQSIVHIAQCSLLREFLSVQRDEDRMISKQSHGSHSNNSHHKSCTVAQPSIMTPPHTLKRKSSFYDVRQCKRLVAPPSPPTTISSIVHHDDAVHIDQFELIKVLGKGATGKVILVKRQAKLYALKTINKSWNITTREVNHIKMERDILATVSDLRHPFLIQLHWAFQDMQNLYLVLDYHAGADLATLLQRFICFPKEQCRLYCAEIVMGLQELHRHHILYRDLKPENVLLASDGHIVLTDFGLSKMFSDNEEHRTTTYCGTPEYLAPEIILQEEEYSYAADYWSLGTMLYEMITGITPFGAPTPDEMYERVLYDDLLFPAHFDPEAMDLIAGLLERDPFLRLGSGVSGVFEIRTHPYFINHLNWKDVYAKRVKPMYVPLTSSETDLSNFDPDFLRMSTHIKEENDEAILLRQKYLPEHCPAGLTENAFRGYSFIRQSDGMVNQNESEFTFFNDEDDTAYRHISDASFVSIKKPFRTSFIDYSHEDMDVVSL